MSDKSEKKPKKTAYQVAQEILAEELRGRFRLPPGTLSNMEIRRRNGGVKHLFEDDIGGCSANYK